LSGETSIIVFVEVGDLAIRQGMCPTGSIFDTKTQPFFNSSSDGQQHKAVIVQAMISASTVSRVMASDLIWRRMFAKLSQAVPCSSARDEGGPDKQ
tara:strand:+ start:707 stop:994 length:288 start_codon:yes stop_codon:yes gene_type:complete